jgi:hypothetical protein
MENICPYIPIFSLSRYPLPPPHYFAPINGGGGPQRGKGLDYSQVNSSRQDGSRQQGQGVVVFATNSFTLWPAASLF